ncbi:hypothetical protein B0H15DRAFT_1028091 [Mycena belliarum]|uniref:GST N-terminal domain-containing protein n=1 Tax=Mycena belliarum TaxID=1033014 RepID=A0AAD6XHH6_9AGAR|nr:hypothetical protein B0H15DRAFT_1028091 [Mycena belliae]
MSTQPIIFYDIPSTAPGCAWSPNTWKIRYAFNLKGLPYKTTWIEYPDIADLCKSIGAEPTMIRKDGSPYYSLPVIKDPNTGAVVSDSARIADYLDATYPNLPKLMPAGTETLQRGFRVAAESATDPLTPYVIPAVAHILHPRSKEYFVRTREERFGKKLEDVVPTGEAHDVAWKALEAGYAKINGWTTPGSPFVMGDTVSYADLVIAAELQWCLKAFGANSDSWKGMMAWHEGRWARLISDLQRYEGPNEDVHA